MKNHSPLTRLEKHHIQVIKNIEKMNSLVNEIDAGGLEALQMHHHDLVALRHRILNDSVVHFRQEEEVLFPEILKHLPEATETINDLLQDHNQIRTLYHDLLQAITEEKAERFVDIAQTASEVLQRHIAKEDAFLNESGGACITPEKFEEMNYELNVIEQDCANWPSNQL